MARTAAQKRAEKNYEKKRGIRGENWSIVAYPESLPTGWQEILSLLHIPILISPLHDADVNADGEPKKPHYHILLMFDSVKSFNQVKEIADELNAPAPQKMDSKRGAARYLCHLDNPEKEPYDPEDIVALSGADYIEIIDNGVPDKCRVVREMMQLVRECEIMSFNRLMDYAAEHNEMWFRALCTNCAYVMKEYIKSYYWENTNME